jgi:small subunit ribosomal protein S6
MIDYEILLMLDPELADERQNEIVARVRENIERTGGSWRGHDVWGRRRLAYEIAHKNEGSYHLLTFTAEPEALEEVSRVLKITDGVMRHLAVRRTASATGPTRPLETRVEQRQDSGQQASPVG